MDLSGKTALVCGASKGIGAAAARELAELGAKVILLARTADALESVRRELKNPDRHRVLAVDVTDRPGLEGGVRQMIDKEGPIAILVNNTGGPKPGPVVEAHLPDFMAAFGQHVLVNQLLVSLCLEGMKRVGYGRIINVLSTSVKIPIPNLGVSNTIRAAVANWSKTLSMELGPFGITVNNILPGYTDTERLDELKTNTAARMKITPDELEKQWINSIPLRRLGEPHEIGQAIAFLASPAASYISGINLTVDGGRTGSL